MTGRYIGSFIRKNMKRWCVKRSVGINAKILSMPFLRIHIYTLAGAVLVGNSTYQVGNIAHPMATTDASLYHRTL